MRLADAGGILGVGIEIIGPAEIVLRACFADGWPVFVPIHVEFDLSLAPPAVIMYAPCQVRQRVNPPELRVEIGGVGRDLRQQVIHLVIQGHGCA